MHQRGHEDASRYAAVTALSLQVQAAGSVSRSRDPSGQAGPPGVLPRSADR